jgi:thymidylate synthase
LIANVTGLEPGTLDWSIKDAHIYVNQVDGIKEQIRRASYLESMDHFSKKQLIGIKEELENMKQKEIELKENEILIDRALDIKLAEEKPYLWVNPEVDNFYLYDNSRELKDIKVKEYKHMGKIEFPIAQ